ncbi:hypothetical protein GCM10023149_50690 [Mucilaginibacter gynuensis]|uniref:MobA/VirD2-like nuclease domain-containing protein n=1 Tax=Mucilaginibacter gynuensis TaxID=1302236 RepID=A0ABP8HIQ6_9SPHI
MIVKILAKPSRAFAGVSYNTTKIDRNKGELMKFANFGALQALHKPKPQDIVNYLKMVASQNKRVSNTQLHAAISARGRQYDKHQLTAIAEAWLKEMGYGSQPYLVVFHKDTENNHVHLVSSRIDRQGRQINRDFEHVRSLRALDKVLGYTTALQYRFSTIAQFYLVIESLGYPGKDYPDQDKLMEKIAGRKPDTGRIAELKTLFLLHKSHPDFKEKMRSDHRIDIIVHAAEGRKPYGYSVVDHDTRQVFKGSEILSIKYLLENSVVPVENTVPVKTMAAGLIAAEKETDHADYIGPVWIADDVDDESVYGRNRQRKRKAGTNTR